jgi:hypothetical protein
VGIRQSLNEAQRAGLADHSPVNDMSLITRVRQFGYRNLAYLAFVAGLLPLAWAIDASGMVDAEDGGGLGLAAMLWLIVSVAFFLANAVLATIAGAMRRSLGISLIGCALPLLCVVLFLLSLPPWMRYGR